MERPLIMFTKHLQGLDAGGLIDALRSVGAAGADLCVRPGHPVEPENIRRTLPPLVREFAAAGLSVPLATLPVRFVDPADAVAGDVFAACADAGVRFVKLGYWQMGPGGYWTTVDEVRRALDGFASLAARTGVAALVHTHSGLTMGVNASSVMNLVRGFDPRSVAVFLDPGHLSLVGEPIPMAFDIVGEHCAAVAVKDLLRERVLVENCRSWRLRVMPLGEGYLDWDALGRELAARRFSGPISMHSEYGELDRDGVLDQTRMDIRFFRALLARSAASAAPAA